MCLTEPQAGSDVGAATTRAIRRDDGTYEIKGTKIFISGGDQDLTENIIHLVLARTDDAPAGTKGLSLFIVPKVRLDGTPNDVLCTGIEHKMGIKASSTAMLSFGDNDGCVGELVGTVEQKGMSQMFLMMNFARIGVGIQGLAVASSAYLNALAYTPRPQAGLEHQGVEGPRGAAGAHPRAPRRAAHAARHEGAGRGHPGAGGQADHPHRPGPPARRGDAPRPSTTAARSTCWSRWSRPTAPTRPSRSARPRSRPTAAPATSRTGRSSSTAATRRSSRSTRAPTTSRRSTWSGASSARRAGPTSRRSPRTSARSSRPTASTPRSRTRSASWPRRWSR